MIAAKAVATNFLPQNFFSVVSFHKNVIFVQERSTTSARKATLLKFHLGTGPPIVNA